MSEPITRRAFVAETALATLALSGAKLPAGLLSPHGPRARRDQPKKVLIVGAGLAGLAAGYELVKAGHEVILLEAQVRAGGRVLTLRSPFGEGLYADAGATRIPDNHEWTLRYVEMFGLELGPFEPADSSMVYHLRGARSVAAPGANLDWPYAITARERTIGVLPLVRQEVERTIQEVGDPTRPGWPSSSLRALDELSFEGYLRTRGLSKGAIELHRALAGGYPYGAMSALWVIRNRFWRHKTQRYVKISGGNDRLPEAFATRLADHIRYGARVVRIEQDHERVRATYTQGGTSYSAEADHLISAVPLTLLRDITIPGLSAAKQRAIREVPYSSTTKVFLQMRRPFWTGQGLSGFALTDLPVQEVWNVAHNEPSSRGILVAYMVGANGLRMGELSDAERIRTTLVNMDKVFPGARENFEGAATKSWDRDPWVRGANVYFKPGQMTTLAPIVGQAEGRIHFAGEHTSAWNNWMQGALESGHRAAAEVNAI